MMTAVAATPTPRGHLLSRSDDQRSMMRAMRGLDLVALPSLGGAARAAA
jgi:hypothetical protein